MTNTNNITRYGASRPNCPFCSAMAGAECRTAKGRITSRHAARVAAEAAYSEAEAAHYAAEIARVEAEAVEVATFSANNMTCPCGQHHPLMNGQVLVYCRCGANYSRPKLGYLETATVKALAK